MSSIQQNTIFISPSVISFANRYDLKLLNMLKLNIYQVAGH